MAISSWVGSGPQAYLMEVGLQNPAWREVTLAVAYGSSLEFLLYSGPQSAFPLALSPPGLPGITSGLNDSLHPTVYVSVFCFSHGYLTHWLSHGLLRLPQHAPGSLCDCPSSSVSFQDFRVPVGGVSSIAVCPPVSPDKPCLTLVCLLCPPMSLQQDPSQLFSAPSAGQCLLALWPSGSQPQRTGLPLPPCWTLWPPGTSGALLPTQTKTSEPPALGLALPPGLELTLLN